MDSGVTPTHSKKPAFVIIVLVLLLLGLVYVYGQNKTNTQKKSSSNAEWVNYKATKYGFQFSYPKSWGLPNVNETEASTGNHYDVRFYVKRGVPSLHFISMDSGSLGLTKNKVQKAITSNSANIVKRDSTSYSTVDVYPTFGTQSQLSIRQIINLPKVNVSAVTYTYLINGKLSNCPVGRFSPADKNCITENAYNTGLKVIKSIKAI
jgi:hypothetical protein